MIHIVRVTKIKTKTLRMSLREELCKLWVVVFIQANFELELICVMDMEFTEIPTAYSMRGNGRTIKGVDKEDISQTS